MLSTIRRSGVRQQRLMERGTSGAPARQAQYRDDENRPLP
jgi:hypothetical protein